MKAPLLFREYIWLVNTIQQAGKISFQEINRRWTNCSLSYGIAMHRNTFCRHKEAVQEIFGINIECERKDGSKYYIENTEVLQEDSIQNWMLSSIAVHTAVQESANLQERILLEEIPSGQTHLQPLLEAMKDNLCIALTYQKYGGEEIKSYPHVEPVCLKLYKQRWYLFANIEDKIRNFSLDRIKSIDLLQDTFPMSPNFDAEAYFKDFYGAYHTDSDKPQNVVLRAFGTERFYLRDLPLHHSQREIATSSDYSDFAYRICTTDDFIGEILRKANRLKVIEPQTLQDKIHSLLKDMLKNYE